MGSPGMPQLSPQQIQQFMQMVQQRQAGAGGQPPQGQQPMQPQSGGQPGATGVLQQRQGSGMPTLPGVPAVAPSQPKKPSMQFQGIPAMVMGVQQKLHQSKVDKATQLAAQWIAFKSNPDPKIQQAAEAMQSDPKNHKIFANMVKPGTPEWEGVQKAYQNVSMEEQQKQASQAEMREKQAKILETLTRAAKERSLTPQTAEERGVALGTLPSADAKEQSEQRRQTQKENLEMKQKTLDQSWDLRKEQLADKRATDRERTQVMQEMVEVRKAQVQSTIEMNAFKMEQKSKLPPSLIPRVEQAKQIKLMISELQTQLNDPEIRGLIGPVKGQGAFVTKRFSEKFAKFNSNWQSLVAMQAIMHGYRGGASMDQVFMKASVGMGQTPDSMEGVLKGLSVLPDNFINDIKAQHPSDPIWEGIEGTETKSTTTGPVVHKMD